MSALRRLVALTALLLGTAGAVTARAQQPSPPPPQTPPASLTADRACYVNGPHRARVTIGGNGFMPGDTVTVSAAGYDFTATAVVDATGAFLASARAPALPPGAGVRTLVLTATDETNPAAAPVTTTIRAANLAMSARLAVHDVLSQKAAYSFSGFTPGRVIYGYWKRRSVLARMRLGRATGPCGVLRRRALLYPGGHPAFKRYTVVFEQRRRYSPRARPRVTARLTLYRY